MATHSFTLRILNEEEATDELAEAIYGSGCDDCLVSSSMLVVKLDFDREAPSRKIAISSAMEDARKAGYETEIIEE